jgi:ABC-type antimicrobial peptide transport system permease subunit
VSTGAGRGRPPRRLVTLAVANLARTPLRTLLGAGGLAIGVAALTMLLGVTFAFRGQVTGTLLGEAISFEARTVDQLAVAVTVALGVVSVADVLYLNVSERADELALLQAVGWTDAQVGRLVAAEALGIGVLGGLLGAAAGLAATGAFAGATSGGLVAAAGAALAGGVGVAVVAAVVPLAMLRRLPVAQVLSQE